MAYQVLARKWRPQTFAEVVGQEHISRTLKNAIVQNRIGHAYLFVGSRGIGKTTTARIFAKALNCPNNKDGEPCCKCESCLEVANGSSMDVIEIDGASHNKVEDIRDIRDNVQYAPTRGRYKIYIIDEVHMLTVQAWNALLKTLEEPPPHVKVLFATTEPHKVLPTIVSRCQRFDLKRLSVPLIVSRLRQIATGENINIEDAALAAIARAADGGMRDAQSIFDQIIAFCGTGTNEIIHEQDVIDVFGLASGLELREIAAAIFSNDLNAALKILQKLADCGRDLERLYADLIEYVRNIMVAGLCNNASEILEVSETELTDLSNIGHAIDPHIVQRALQSLIAQEWSFRAALNKRIYFEATLARVMLETHSVQLDDVFAHLNRISGALPQTPLPQRPQIIIPPPVINYNQPPKQENPNPQTPSGQTVPANVTETPKTTQPLEATSDNSDKKDNNPSETTAAVHSPEATPHIVPTVQPAEEPPAEAPAPKAEQTTQPPATAPAPKAEQTTQPPAQTAQPAEKTQTPEAPVQTEETVVPAQKAEETTQPPAEAPVPTAQTAEETTQPPATAPAQTAQQAEEAAPSESSTQVIEPQQVASTNETQQGDQDNSDADAALLEASTNEEPVNIIDINAQLMQASAIDIEDEADPALADTGESSLMAAYNPTVVHEKLVEQLSEMGGNYAKIGETVSNLVPQALGQYGLTLLCEQSRMTSADLALLSDSATMQQLNQAFKALHLSGSVKINYSQEGRGGPQVRYKPASFMDMQSIRADEFVAKANRMLGTEVIEGRVPEKRQ